MNKLSFAILLFLFTACFPSSQLSKHHSSANGYNKTKVTKLMLKERLKPGECLIGHQSFSPEGTYFTFHPFFPKLRCIQQKEGACYFTLYNIKILTHETLYSVKGECNQLALEELAALASQDPQYKNALAHFLEYNILDNRASAIRFHALLWEDEKLDKAFKEAYEKALLSDIKEFVARRPITGRPDPRL